MKNIEMNLKLQVEDDYNLGNLFSILMPFKDNIKDVEIKVDDNKINSSISITDGNSITIPFLRSDDFKITPVVKVKDSIKTPDSITLNNNAAPIGRNKFIIAKIVEGKFIFWYSGGVEPKTAWQEGFLDASMYNCLMEAKSTFEFAHETQLVYVNKLNVNSSTEFAKLLEECKSDFYIFEYSGMYTLYRKLVNIYMYNEA